MSISKTNLRYVLVTCLLFRQGYSTNQSAGRSSRITEVTVFLNRAQVTRQLKTQLPAGKSNLIVTGLTSLLDPQSIQVSGKGNFIILGTSHQQNYLSELNMPKALKSLKGFCGVTAETGSTGAKSKRNIEQRGTNADEQPEDRRNQSKPYRSRTQSHGPDFYRSRLTEIVSARMKEG